MRLCSGRLQAAMWSCKSCWEKFWCIWAASWASMVFPQALFRSAGEKRSLWIMNCECGAADHSSSSMFNDFGSWCQSHPWICLDISSYCSVIKCFHCPLLIQLWLHYSVVYQCYDWMIFLLPLQEISPCMHNVALWLGKETASFELYKHKSRH